MPPKKHSSTSSSSFNLSYKTLGAIATLMTLLFFAYGAIGRIATKEDVKELALTYNSSYSAIEIRVRQLEIQFASFFGKSAATPSMYKPSVDSARGLGPKLIRVQSVQSIPEANAASASQSTVPKLPPRRAVATMDFIKTHDLTPSRGGSYAVLGEDGNYYALDDILAILIREHHEDMHRQLNRK